MWDRNGSGTYLISVVNYHGCNSALLETGSDVSMATFSAFQDLTQNLHSPLAVSQCSFASPFSVNFSAVGETLGVKARLSHRESTRIAKSERGAGCLLPEDKVRSLFGKLKAHACMMHTISQRPILQGRPDKAKMCR